MIRRLARAIFPLVVLAVAAALTAGASGTCCIGNLCLLGGPGGSGVEIDGGGGSGGGGDGGGAPVTLFGPVNVPVNGLSLNKWEVTIAAGSTEQLVAIVYPEYASERGVAWSSTDDSVATVSASGLVSAVDNGTAKITATTVDQQLTATCEVTVVDQEADQEADQETGPEADLLAGLLELTIRDAADNVSSVFSEGSEVRFLIAMQNPTDELLWFGCGDKQLYDIRVVSSDNALVWNWAHGRDFAQVGGTWVCLESGEEDTYNEAWDQKDNEGDPVPPGRYAVYLDFLCVGLKPCPQVFGPLYIEIAASPETGGAAG